VPELGKIRQTNFVGQFFDPNALIMTVGEVVGNRLRDTNII